MKSDREMIESLLKRRDEYMAQNRSFKRVKNKIRNKARDKVRDNVSSPVRLIPKTALTSLAVIAVIVCVLAFNGVFDRKKVNIDLNIGAGSSNMANTAIPAASAAEENTETDKKDVWDTAFSGETLLPSETRNPSISENETAKDNEIRVSDIMDSVLNNMYFVENGSEVIEIHPLPVESSEYIVYNGMIYGFVDPEHEDYSSLGFDENTVVIADSLHRAVIYEGGVKDLTPDEIFGSVYEVKGAENYVTVIYEKNIWLYRAEKPACLTIGDNIYRIYLPLEDSEWFSSSNILIESGAEYSAYYAVIDKFDQICDEKSGMPVYIVKSNKPNPDEEYEAWISYSKNPLPPEEYRLNINARGRIEDTAQNIENYCRNLSNGVFKHDTYEILSWNEDNIVNNPSFREFVYKGDVYTPVNGNTDPDTVLTVETNIEAGGQDNGKMYCTVFRVRDNKDMIAAFCNGVLHYFAKEGGQAAIY